MMFVTQNRGNSAVEAVSVEPFGECEVSDAAFVESTEHSIRRTGPFVPSVSRLRLNLELSGIYKLCFKVPVELIISNAFKFLDVINVLDLL